MKNWIDSHRKLTGIITAVALIVCFSPWIPFTPHFGASARLPAYANFGTWLQGVLTPAILVLALLSFQSQGEASRQQFTVQMEANRISNRTFFIASADRFVQHLAYRSYCAILNHSAEDITRHNPDYMGKVLDTMAGAFRGGEDGLVSIGLLTQYITSLQEIRSNQHYAILERDIEAIVSAGQDADLLSLLDNRILRIREGIRKYPPIPTSG